MHQQDQSPLTRQDLPLIYEGSWSEDTHPDIIAYLMDEASDLDPLFDFTEPLPDLDLPGLGDPVLDFGDPDLDLADPEDPERDLDLDLLESDPESFAFSPSRYLSFLLLPMSDI